MPLDKRPYGWRRFLRNGNFSQSHDIDLATCVKYFEIRGISRKVQSTFANDLKDMLFNSIKESDISINLFHWSTILKFSFFDLPMSRSKNSAMWLRSPFPIHIKKHLRTMNSKIGESVSNENCICIGNFKGF